MRINWSIPALFVNGSHYSSSGCLCRSRCLCWRVRAVGPREFLQTEGCASHVKNSVELLLCRPHWHSFMQWTVQPWQHMLHERSSTGEREGKSVGGYTPVNNAYLLVCVWCAGLGPTARSEGVAGECGCQAQGAIGSCNGASPHWYNVGLQFTTCRRVTYCSSLVLKPHPLSRRIMFLLLERHTIVINDAISDVRGIPSCLLQC